MRFLPTLSVCNPRFPGRHRRTALSGLLAIGVIGLAMACFSGPAPAKPGPAPWPMSAKVTIVSAQQMAGGIGTPLTALPLTVISPGEASCDLGRLVVGFPQTRCRIVLRNDTKETVTLTRINTSTGCVRAAADVDPLPPVGGGPAAPGVAPVIVPPGHRVVLHVLLDASALPSGALDQRVWVMAQGQTEPAASLRLTGMLVPTLQVSPRSLDFGRVSAPDCPSLPLSITLNSRLASGQATVSFSCPDAEVRVVPVPKDVPPSSKPLTGAGQVQSLNYRVVLAPTTSRHKVGSRLALLISVTPISTPGIRTKFAPAAVTGGTLVMVPISADIVGAGTAR